MDEQLFCGENRRRELKRLIRAYDDVAAAAASVRPGEAPKGPTHRVVLIHAERGLGKTRLAMELYRWLSQHADPDRYWPDDYARLAEGVAVTPAAENCRYVASPLFLWWGMQIGDGPNPGNTVFQALDDLLPHLTRAQIEARRRASGRDVAKEALDVALEAGAEIVEDATGYGSIKKIGEALWTIGRIVRRHGADARGAVEQAREVTDTVVDSVMSDLGRLFSPRSRSYAGMPLVILVDDAQFADRDQAMAAFLERLIATAARDGWPVLLILTHWSRHLRRWQDARGEWRERSAAAEVLRHAQEAAAVEPGRFAGQPGGALTGGRLIEIDLGDPVDDLAPALTARFPGLAGSTVAEIADKAGGNPRKLEQIMAEMADQPAWFAGGDDRGDLTPEGRAAALALSRLDIDRIVEKRFEDTPLPVRRALTLAAVTGVRFVVDLVERLAQSRFACAARDGLEEGETRYRFVRNVVDRSRSDVAAFAERLFADAAASYRRSGRARRDLPDWPDDADLYAALDDLLDAIVADPPAFGGLRADEVALALELASDRMALAGSPRAGLALARLVRLENARGNPEGAYAAAGRFIEGFRE